MTKYLHVKYFGAAIWQEEALHVIDLRVGDAAKIRADVDDQGPGQVKIVRTGRWTGRLEQRQQTLDQLGRRDDVDIVRLGHLIRAERVGAALLGQNGRVVDQQVQTSGADDGRHLFGHWLETVMIRDI